MLEARNNPFRSRKVDNISFIGADVYQLATRFKELDCRASIVGKQGTGKSTLLLELCELFDGHYAKIESLRDVFELPKNKTLFIDGTEKVPLSSTLLFASRQRFLLTLHKRGAAKVLHQTTTSSALLEEITCQLQVYVPKAQVEKLFFEHHGNIRNCLRSLYDEFGVRSGG